MHLEDARALLGTGRFDGTAYHAGYVAECSLKTLILHEKGAPAPGAPLPWKKGAAGHNLGTLHAQVATFALVAGTKTARYFGDAIKNLTSSSLATWNPESRYHKPSLDEATAKSWFADAESVYSQTIGEMLKNGEL